MRIFRWFGRIFGGKSIFMELEKLYGAMRDKTLHNTQRAKASLLLNTLVEFSKEKNLGEERKALQTFITDVKLIQPDKLEFRFFDSELMRIEAKTYLDGSFAVIDTYNIVDDHDNYPHTKAVRLDEVQLMMDNQGGLKHVESEKKISSNYFDFVEDYIELVYDWYYSRKPDLAPRKELVS